MASQVNLAKHVKALAGEFFTNAALGSSAYKELMSILLKLLKKKKKKTKEERILLNSFLQV